jgi:hypothetical protein
MRDVPAPSHPLAHTGAFPPFCARIVLILRRSSRRWRGHIIVRLLRPSRIHSTHDGSSIPSFSAEASSHLFSSLLASYPTHNLGILFRCRDCRSCQSDMCNQGRTFAMPPSSPAADRGLWSTSLDLLGFFIYWPVRVGGFCAIFHEEGWRRLHRDVARNIQREQRRAAINGEREDEWVGI